MHWWIFPYDLELPPFHIWYIIHTCIIQTFANIWKSLWSFKGTWTRFELISSSPETFHTCYFFSKTTRPNHYYLVQSILMKSGFKIVKKNLKNDNCGKVSLKIFSRTNVPKNANILHKSLYIQWNLKL